MFHGAFEACKNAQQLLKDEVGKPTLSTQKRKELVETSSADSRMKKRTPVSKGTKRDKCGLAQEWFPQKLVEPVTQVALHAHKVLETKLMGASEDFKQWLQVR